MINNESLGVAYQYSNGEVQYEANKMLVYCKIQ